MNENDLARLVDNLWIAVQDGARQADPDCRDHDGGIARFAATAAAEQYRRETARTARAASTAAAARRVSDRLTKALYGTHKPATDRWAATREALALGSYWRQKNQVNAIRHPQGDDIIALYTRSPIQAMAKYRQTINNLPPNYWRATTT